MWDCRIIIFEPGSWLSDSSIKIGCLGSIFHNLRAGTTAMKGIRVETSTWPRIEALLLAGAGAVLPIGAACKEHGRHLPMNTDRRQADWISNRLLEQFELVLWPVVTYGYYPVFVDYPGSISLSEQTFIDLVGDVLDGIEHAGARRVILLNTGISTISPLQEVITSRTDPTAYQLINVYAGPRFTRTAELLSEQQWGGHADEIETSIMLAIDEKVVDLALAHCAPTEIARGRFNRWDPTLPNYSPDGVNGDPSVAKRWKGDRLLDAMLADVVCAIGDDF